MLSDQVSAIPMNSTSSRSSPVLDRSMCIRWGCREMSAPILMANSEVEEERSLLLKLNILRERLFPSELRMMRVPW